MVYNGGLVVGMTTTEDRKTYPQEIRHKLLNHRAKNYHYLVDRLMIVNSDLREVLEYVRSNVSENWYKTIKGRIVGLMLVRCMDYELYPAKSSHRGDLIFYANYAIIQSYLFRLVKVLILHYDFPHRYYAFKVPSDELYKQSVLWFDSMYEDSIKMVKHYKRLISK
ncbi:MAG: hypothetical protein SPLUMA2_SPLUMAMAG2_00113 [uncultured Sulfurimonas sp.]|nr:MAG: hypothetical protein SPLUMA2_SPLUMAMAG2_00113 [uncultured Sulfurimonas sp.]